MIELATYVQAFDQRLVQLGYTPQPAIDEAASDAWPVTTRAIEVAGVPCLLDIYHVNAEDPAERSTATNTLAKQVNAARDLGKAAFTHMQILLESNLFCVLAAPGSPQSVEPQLADAMGQIMDYRTMGVALSHIQASAGSK